MADPLQQLTDADLRTLAAALAGGRLAEPYTTVGVGRFVQDRGVFRHPPMLPAAVMIETDAKNKAAPGYERPPRDPVWFFPTRT